MHQIGVVGLSYRHVGVDEVARFALPKADVAARLPALRDLLRASEILYVGTCNRVEVLFATNDGSPAGDSRRDVFRALTGHDPQPAGLDWRGGGRAPLPSRLRSGLRANRGARDRCSIARRLGSRARSPCV